MRRTTGEEENTMAEQISALVVHAQDETYHGLLQTLNALGIRVVHARNCREASLLLKKDGGIDLVFTGPGFPDGGWAEVVELVQHSKTHLPVIVVSAVADVELYLEALGRGAFDFVTPPFLTSDMAHVVRSAIYKELLSAKQDLIAPPVA